eukprot:scaffold32514_cov36-Phaeocystis_antarctica.AAC.1
MYPACNRMCPACNRMCPACNRRCPVCNRRCPACNRMPTVHASCPAPPARTARGRLVVGRGTVGRGTWQPASAYGWLVAVHAVGTGAMLARDHVLLYTVHTLLYTVGSSAYGRQVAGRGGHVSAWQQVAHQALAVAGYGSYLRIPTYLPSYLARTAHQALPVGRTRGRGVAGEVEPG